MLPNNWASAGADAPAIDGAAVTPNDAADLALPARALWIGAGGTLRITTLKGTVLNFTAVPSGFVMPVAAVRVHATGTTCTGIVALH